MDTITMLNTECVIQRKIKLAMTVFVNRCSYKGIRKSRRQRQIQLLKIEENDLPRP